MCRFLKLLCLCSLFLVAVPSLWAETLTPAPLNPAFVEYQQQAMKAATSGEPAYPTERRPSPVDLSHLAGQPIVPDADLKTAATDLETYDLRELGFISPVKDQRPYGNCWTFSVMSSMESTAMKLLGAKSADLSEWELTYYAYIDEDPELVAFGDHDPTEFPEPVAYLDGDDFRATAILSRGTGPALESDIPLGGAAPTGNEPAAYHLSDVMFLYYDQDTKWGPVSEQNVKYALTHYGAVSVGTNAAYGIGLNGTTLYWNPSTCASYIPPNTSDEPPADIVGHVVTIVGWNDNYSRSNFTIDPGQDGAWIIRNSLGTDSGDNGYYYLSYRDAVLSMGTTYVVAPADSYDNTYQHDPLGLCNMKGIADAPSPNEAWMANIFVSEGIQALKAVSFYAPAVDTEYEISVYTGGEKDPLEGILAFGPKTGTLHEPGYRTVKLDKPVLLPAGETFSVVVKLTTPGYNFPIAMEYAIIDDDEDYSSKATANAGESFFSGDGLAWTDTTDADPTANVCLKAFTSDLKLEANQGGCHIGSLVQAGLLLLIPLTFLKKQ